MKFLVLKTKDRKPGQPQFRIFLADGAELTGAIRIAMRGGPAQTTVTLHSIDEPSPDKPHFEVDSLELEFLCPEVEVIENEPERSPSLEGRLRSLIAKWRSHWAVAEHQGCDKESANLGAGIEDCADELEELLNQPQQRQDGARKADRE